MAAQPGWPAFSNVFHMPATIRMTKASQAMQPRPPKQPASSPPAPRSSVSDCISARNGTIESIPPPFLKRARRDSMPGGEARQFASGRGVGVGRPAVGGEARRGQEALGHGRGLAVEVVAAGHRELVDQLRVQMGAEAVLLLRAEDAEDPQALETVDLRRHGQL